MHAIDALLLTVVLLSLFFTFTNGFQDGSSVCAAAITSRAMTPLQAISFVAACEVAGALFGGSAVAHAMQGISVLPATPQLLPVLISALVAAISWNYVTRWAKVPSSSTHALVGGIIGGVYTSGGAAGLHWGSFGDGWHATGIAKVFLALLLSPVVGFSAGFVVLVLFTLMLAHASMRANKYLKWLQWLTTGLMAFGHGANDPQKSMGVIMMALYSAGLTIQDIPTSVRFGTGLAMAIGIMALAPGIVQNIGARIFRLRTLHAVSSETASAIVIVTGSLFGGPLSASQVISSTVVGVGAAVRPRRLDWAIVGDMLAAWCLTIPCSAALSALLYHIAFKWLTPS